MGCHRQQDEDEINQRLGPTLQRSQTGRHNRTCRSAGAAGDDAGATMGLDAWRWSVRPPLPLPTLYRCSPIRFSLLCLLTLVRLLGALPAARKGPRLAQAGVAAADDRTAAGMPADLAACRSGEPGAAAVEAATAGEAAAEAAAAASSSPRRQVRAARLSWAPRLSGFPPLQAGAPAPAATQLLRRLTAFLLLSLTAHAGTRGRNALAGVLAGAAGER